jgi:NAD(P)H-quinone oxidoreductase subunit 2
MIALYFQWDTTNPIGFLSAFNSDDLSIVFRGIIALSAVTILMSIRYIEQSGTALANSWQFCSLPPWGMFYLGRMSW